MSLLSKITQGHWTASPVSSVVGSIVMAGSRNVVAVLPQADAQETRANAELVVKAKKILEQEEGRAAERVCFDEFCALPYAKLERTTNLAFWEASYINWQGIFRRAIAQTPQEAIRRLLELHPQTEDAQQ